MIFLIHIIIFSVLSYLTGSINPAIILSKKIYGTDIRTVGSKNAGASNTVRNYGIKAGAAVFILDFAKGLLAVTAAKTAVEYFGAPYITVLASGFFVQVGHTFPVFYKYKGGKGVATAAGAAMGIMPLTATVLLLCFAAILLITKTVALASGICAAGYPLLAYFFSVENKNLNFIFAASCAIVIALKHSSNFIRLINGEEEKIRFGKRRNNSD